MSRSTKHDLLWLMSLLFIGLLWYGYLTEWRYTYIVYFGPREISFMWPMPRFLGLIMATGYTLRGAWLAGRGRFSSPLSHALLALALMGLGYVFVGLWELWQFARNYFVYNSEPIPSVFTLVAVVLALLSALLLALWLRVVIRGYRHWRKGN